ncbi:MAG: glycosyltransferase [Candidatus Micrarchaeia archaeon]|jgi:glycosyltransferase involved in cell wall biosynthesis
MIDISVIIPAYNKGKIVEQRIENVYNFLKNNKQINQFEIIAINDGSKDDTLQKLSNFTFSEYTLINLEKNMGKGYALRQGFQKAKYSYVAFLDADNDLPIDNLESLILKIKNNSCDAVICSKNHPKSKVENPNRGILSKGYFSFSNNLLKLPISDSQVGAKIFKKEVLDTILPKLCVNRFAFDSELLTAVSSKNYKINEIPVTLMMDNTEKSTVDVKQMGHMFVDTCAIAYRKYFKKWYE